ncbi:hypothetical protein [Metabacillus endolithicus]|uniref:hypothetical protein n=1 Tax=Metabacillus endolithicus TaxID=1535204 RepID=UPI003671AD6B
MEVVEICSIKDKTPKIVDRVKRIEDKTAKIVDKSLIIVDKPLRLPNKLEPNRKNIEISLQFMTIFYNIKRLSL